ncbi:MAG TPA: chloride channel protein [Polyangiaceae bacterium]|jgi:CIC family chloride channel protein|nr:chloride channel protein [Polyangiaceae bacterium]
MSDETIPAGSVTGAGGRVPIAPSLAPTLAQVNAPTPRANVDARVAVIGCIGIALGIAAAFVARVLTSLIGFITNLAFYGHASVTSAGPAENHLGLWVIVVPAIGGLIVGAMARYGSAAIRGHGIPEAMEQVLFNESRIPPRVTFLKPLSAAISIGTGGPFGAEGPIIATGGALGSLVGQIMRVSAEERKTLLAAGAAAGMSATFGSPVSAVLLAVELLLFEYRIRSLVPVALASCAAAAARLALVGGEPAFTMPAVGATGSVALAIYVAMGVVLGFFSMLVTRAVYAVEDAFEKLPIHWMWWPTLGSVMVGLVGYVSPHTMGVGYDNIDRMLSGDLAGTAAISFGVLKFVSWSLSLGTGTSGGTLAPLFTIGGGLGSAMGAFAIWAAPEAGVDLRIAALVGMAALFAGASRALLASVVFAFETTRQPMSLLPLLAGCTAAFLVSALSMRHSIMTAKIARRGARVVSDYVTDFLEQVVVGETAVKPVITLRGTDTLDAIRAWIGSHAPGSEHQGFPVVDDDENLIGVVTRRDMLGDQDGAVKVRDLVKRRPAIAFGESSLREAADHMVREGVGRLPVVARSAPTRVIGIITRSDLLGAHGARLDGYRLNAPRYALPVRTLVRAAPTQRIP